MPYISEEQRKPVQPALCELISKINEALVDDRDGILNYCISELVCQCLRPASGWRYRMMERAIGVLECCKLEMYRRLVGPYEDKAVDKNGDIESYSQP